MIEEIRKNKNLVIWDEGSYHLEFVDMRTDYKYLIKEINGVLNFFIVTSKYPTRAVFKGRKNIISFLKILNNKKED